MNGRFLWRSGWLLLLLVVAVAPGAPAVAAPPVSPAQVGPLISPISLNAPWTPVGPSSIVTSAFGPVTGRVTAIAADPTDPTGNTVYVGATGGGVWKSTNAAGPAASVTFAPTTDTVPGVNYTTSDLGSISIGALSVQPSPPPGISPVILAGTGDPNDALDSYYGDGILRSTDNGATWTLISHSSDNQFTAGPDWFFYGLSFSGFAWSTANPNLVVAAVSSALEGQAVNAGYGGDAMMGLYYSTDAGVTWRLAVVSDGGNQTIQSPNINFGTFSGNAATSVVWNPIRQVFLAAIRNHGYYQSPDGVNWTRLASQPGAGLSRQNCPAQPGSPGATSCPIFRGALAVQPLTGDTFAITTDLSNNDFGLFQDRCAASNGVCAAPLAFPAQLPTAALEVGNGSTAIPRADYNLSLLAVPQAGDTLLFAGTQDLFRCSLAAGCVWRNSTNVATCAAAQVAPAQHALAWAPNSSALLVGNDGGLWRSMDLVNQQQPACSSDDAAHFNNLNPGLGSAADGSIAEVAAFAQDPNSASTILAAAAQNGTAAGTSAATAWPQVTSAAAAYTAIDPANPQNWYVTSGPGVAISLCNHGSACTSSDFQPAITESQVSNDGLPLLRPAVFALDPANSANILVGTCRVWRGPANGSGWSAGNAISRMLDGDNAPSCQSGPSANAQIRSLAASGPVSGRTDSAEFIYAGMAGSMDGGATAAGHLYSALVAPGAIAANTTWTDLSLSPVANDPNNAYHFNPGHFAIGAIALDPHDPTAGTLYAGIAGFSGQGMMQFVSEPVLYVSIDGGQHWTNITANLPAVPINSVVVDPNSAQIVYVANDFGVYVTTTASQCGDTGSMCWDLYDEGLPAAPVRQLLPFTGAGQGLLRAATYGRGLWQTTLVSLSSPGGGGVASATLAPATVTFSPASISTTSPYQTVTLLNTGAVPLQLASITVTGDFVQQSSCPATLAPGSSCTVQVAFSPSATGTRTGVLTVFANVAGGQLTVSLTGQGTAPGLVVLTPSRVSFASTLVGAQSPTQYLTVANTGGTAISLQTPSVTGPFLLTANTCAASLPPDTSCTVGIAFAPVTDGSALGQFSISDDLGTQTAPLLGVGVTGPTDILAPVSLTFPGQTIATTSAPQAVTLTNNGDTALTLIQVLISAGFAVQNQCGASLAPHSTCALQVTFAPSSAGAVSGQLIVADALRSQTVALNGSGVALAGSATITPSTLNFGPEGVGVTSAPQTLTLSNNGPVPVSNPGTTVTGDFLLSGNSCTATIAPGQQCTLQVVFHPSATGPRAGLLTLSSPGLSAPVASQLTGSGLDFAISVEGSTSAIVVGGNTASYLLQIAPVGESAGVVALACAGAPAGSQCVVNPSPVNLISGATSTVTLTIATPAPAAARVHGLGAAGFALAAILPFGIGLRRNLPRALSVCLLATVTLAAAGCGVGITGGNATGAPSPGGSGNYTVTVTASAAGVQHAVTVSLTVE